MIREYIQKGARKTMDAIRPRKKREKQSLEGTTEEGQPSTVKKETKKKSVRGAFDGFVFRKTKTPRQVLSDLTGETMKKPKGKMRKAFDNAGLSSFLIGRLSVKEQALFAKRLSFLIGAGVPVLESLHVLKDQTTSRSVRRILNQIIKDVANGRFLSSALDRFRHYFGEFAINIIKVGESSGVLSKNLQYLAEELEKKEVLRKKVVGALVYPIFITLATVGVTGLLTVYIFPKILPIFSSVGVTLPITTKILIAVSGFLASYGLVLIGVLFVLTLGLIIVHRNVSTFRIISDRVMLALPLAGRIMQFYNMANITRTFGLLLKSGGTIVDALDTTARTTRNSIYKRELNRAVEHVKRGEQVSEHFKKHKGLFPILIPHMIAIGERSGNLPDTLVYLSEMYEEEVNALTKNLSNSIEPVLMIVMGLLVGFVAVSVITPIYEITQTISNQI